MRPRLRFVVTRVVDAPNEAIWRVLGDFGSEHRWTKQMSHCERDTAEVRVGTIRSCRLPRPLMGRTEVRETVTEFEPGQALAYSLEGAAGPFAAASSRWSTTPVSDGTTAVTIEGRFEARNVAARLLVWPLAKPMLRRITRGVLRELELFLGSHSPGSTAPRARGS